MANINENYLNLQGSYLFANIAKKVADYQAAHPDADIIRLGIGDVTLPLVPAIIDAMSKAVQEMGKAETFRGYGPEQGYDFLRQAIVDGDYKPLGVDIAIDEVFVSDGAKSDVGNIQELFSEDNIIAITDPVYPVYFRLQRNGWSYWRSSRWHLPKGCIPPYLRGKQLLSRIPF